MRPIYDSTIYNLRFLLRPLALLAFLTLQSSLFVSQVQAQEAFYIYQNDGHFDGFFYDQVQKISYSKLDTLGVEHDDYVSQEIVTADSTFRIMLTAIDSVGFVQPEVKFNPRLREMDERGLSAYFDHLDEQSGAVTLYFRGDMPASLIPAVGDVLAGLDETLYGHDGYFGKVGSVSTEAGFIVCQMNPIDDWGDLFEQFVTVEQVGYYDNGTAARRMAGIPDNRLAHRLASSRSEGNRDFTILSWGGRLQYDAKPVTIGVDVNLEAKLNVVYKATSKRFYMKATITENFSATPSVHISWDKPGEWNFNAPIAFPGIKFPAVLPLFETNPLPKGFARIGGAIDIGITLPKVQLPLSQSLVIDTAEGAENVVYGGFRWGSGSDEDAEKLFSDKLFDDSMDATLVLNGFLQVGSKVEFTVTTNRWIENLFFASIGWEIYSGPKLEGEINLSAAGVIKNGAYGLMKDSKLAFSAFSVDTEAKARIHVGGMDEVEKTIWSDNLKFFTKEWYLFPDFDDTEAEYDPETATLTATVFPTRQTFWSVDVGIGLYDSDDNRVYEAFKGEDYGFSSNYNEVKHVFAVEGLPTDFYNVVPLIKTLGAVMPVKEKAKEVEIDNNKLTVTQQKFEVGPEATAVTTELQTTAATVELVSNAGWLHASRTGTTLKLTVDEMPLGKTTRGGVVTVRGTFANGSMQVAYIQVLQSAFPGEPVIELTPREMTFDARGGEQTAQIATNADELTWNNGGAAWLTGTIDGGTLYVRVDPTRTAGDRTGYLTVGGSKNGIQTADYITVTQKGALALSSYALDYSADGGSQKVTVTTSGDYSVRVVADDEWLKVSYAAGQLDVVADPNYGSGPRNGKVRVLANVEGTEVKATVTVSQKTYITLTPSEIKVGKDGGVFDVAVETSLTALDIQAVVPWVGVGLTDGGRRMTVSVDPNTSETERTGYAHIQGVKDGTTIGVNLVIQQAAGDGEVEDVQLNLFGTYFTFDALNAWSQMVMYESSSDEVVFTPKEPWIHVEKRDGLFGPDGTYRSAMITVDDYTDDTGSSRQGSIEVTLGSITQTITIEQRSASAMPCDLFIDGSRMTSRNFEYMDDPKELVLDARYCTSLYVDASESWIHATVSGNTLTISVDDNMKKEERTGTVTVTGSNANNSVSVTVTVTQEIYRGYTVNAEYDGVIVLIETNDQTYESYLPKSSFRKEGVYGTTSVAGITEVNKKSEAQYTATFQSSGSMGNGDPQWSITMTVDQDMKLLNGYVSYTDNTGYVILNDGTRVEAPKNLSFNVSDVPVEEYSYYYRLYFYEPNDGYKYYDSRVWRVSTQGTDSSMGTVSGFTFQDGVVVTDSDSGQYVTQRMISDKPCTITIYLHQNGDQWWTLPYGHPDRVD